jgi:formylglycine-generating enzyme required for sulfatase activity
MSKYEITVAQFKLFVDATGYQTMAEKGADGFKGSTIWTGSKFEKKEGINWRYDANGNLLADTNYNQPVTHIAWDDAYAFAKWMGCRLPTEAEWEYACRAGTSSPFSFGNCISAEQANYCATYPGGKCPKSNYRAQTLKVGTLPPNGWGLYDMHGNVAEWVYDVYGEYSSGAQTNPFGPEQGSNRVIRGGSWRDNGVTCRSAARTSIFHARSLGFSGFRLVLTK